MVCAQPRSDLQSAATTRTDACAVECPSDGTCRLCQVRLGVSWRVSRCLRGGYLCHSVRTGACAYVPPIGRQPRSDGRSWHLTERHDHTAVCRRGHLHFSRQFCEQVWYSRRTIRVRRPWCTNMRASMHLGRPPDRQRDGVWRHYTAQHTIEYGIKLGLGHAY